ncbi:tropomodulin-like [Uloborus diversus]|uniref:tropomodulin-like n=1 Tax=Uloborus diversus TaxID=327109 RepID=UPI00240A4A19|nr:tropomodulin-like [Uloborus diversus]
MSFLAAKLLGKEVKELDENDIDDLLASLTAEELEQLSNEVDPDDSLLPASQRCKDQTKKAPTGPLNRKKLLDYLERTAKEQEDWPEAKPYEPGLKRGKIWKPKHVPKPEVEEMGIELDIDDEYVEALNTAEEAELVDLAAILGLHSMLNQDQFHSSILNKGQKIGDRFESVVHATKPKVLPLEPDNDTDVDKTLKQVENNDATLKKLNWNNIKNISREKMKRLFEGLKTNAHLEFLSLANVNLYDASAEVLVEALKQNKALLSLNVESNYLTGSMLRDLIDALLTNQTMLEFRAANQSPATLGNKIEMEITKLIEENKTLLRLGLSFDVPDARVRITDHLQKNQDRIRLRRIGTEI